jgi:hypothetical protein
MCNSKQASPSAKALQNRRFRFASGTMTTWQMACQTGLGKYNAARCKVARYLALARCMTSAADCCVVYVHTQNMPIRMRACSMPQFDMFCINFCSTHLHPLLFGSMSRHPCLQHDQTPAEIS